MPWLDYVWINNPIKRFLRGKGVSPGAAFAMARVQERRQALAKGKGKDWNDTSRDFLSRFLEIEEKESVPPYAVAAWAGSNITAGSDTTGIYLRTVFHELLTHPESRDRLRRELDTAASQGALSTLATWGETSKLPYLDACIKEAGRLHPPFALPYERVVPAGGASLCGARVGEGTVVGMSAWAVHRDEELFGVDSDRWRPERWLEVGPERKREMENGLLMVSHPSIAGKVDDADVLSSLALVREFVWGSTLRTWRCIRLLLRF
jgi:cytochrome P450